MQTLSQVPKSKRRQILFINCLDDDEAKQKRQTLRQRLQSKTLQVFQGRRRWLIFFKCSNVVKNKIKSFMSNLCELSFIELAWLYSHSCAQFARTWTILVRNFSVKLQFYFTCEITKLPWQPTALSQSNCRNFSCSSISAKFNHDICIFILLQEKFLQFDWLRAVVFQLNFKYLHVKITNLLWVVV